MAGVAGFEPTHDGVKVRCLTAWLHPNGKDYTTFPRSLSRVFILGWMMGLEPTTPRATIWCSSQLSYTHHICVVRKINGVPGGIRTPDLRIRSPLLYPAELQGHKNGAGEGNRTLATSLEGWGSTIELHPPAKSIITPFARAFQHRI
jgi:hypothetical protein